MPVRRGPERCCRSLRRNEPDFDLRPRPNRPRARAIRTETFPPGSGSACHEGTVSQRHLFLRCKSPGGIAARGNPAMSAAGMLELTIHGKAHHVLPRTPAFYTPHMNGS